MASTDSPPLTFSTAEGQARVWRYCTTRRRRGSVVLGHGAGGGIEAWDLQLLATALPDVGFDVLLVEQPWRVSGRRLAVAPPRLDIAWIEVLDALGQESMVDKLLVVGGRSAGARVACRTASRVSAVGVLGLAFPLHAPGRPEKSRAAELGSGLPTLVIQGTRDSFGSAVEVGRVLNLDSVLAVPGADHGLAVAKSAVITRSEAGQMITDRVSAWLHALVIGESSRVELR